MLVAEVKAVLFDIDGTLIISGGAGATSWRDAFQEIYGVPADISQFSDIGMTDPVVGRKTFQAILHRDPTEEEFRHLLDRRLHHLRAAVARAEDYHVLPGVRDLLPRLLAQGLLLGLVTGNMEDAAHVKLSRGGLNGFFAFGGYGSDSEDRSELTRIALERAALVNGSRLPSDAVLAIGDTPLDVTAAHSAGIACVGVATHNYTVEELREAGADYVLTTLSDGLPLGAP